MFRNCLFVLICAWTLLQFPVFGLSQDVTSKQKRQVKSIASLIDKADRLYDSKKYKSSTDKLDDANRLLQKLAVSANKELMTLLSTEHKRLSEIHERLTKQKMRPSPVQPLPDPVMGDMAEISFATTIAPIIVNNCGRCHVNQSRGQFSAKDYESLMNSLHVSPGRPDTSRIVEVIADGDMPPNGEVEKKDLESLKMWIRQGAKFDGNPKASLNQLAGVENTMAPQNRVRLQPARPKGTETVSFGRDVAPILIESCSGCHINARRIQGNFNMNDFVRMLRGGETGNPLVPGKPEDSLIIKRLKGIDAEVMPPRRKLSDTKIAIVEKWISEGATFDGIRPNSEIATVAAETKAMAQTHDQLSADRDKLGVKNWNLIMSDDKPDQINNSEFRVVGSNRSERLEMTSDMAEELRTLILEELRTEADRPFVKGRATVFVFDKRYDLNELGLMLNGKEIPKYQTGRWDFNVTDAYVSLVLNRGKTMEQFRAELAQQLTSIHVAALAYDVPRWFADGVGYLTASKICKKVDVTKQWSTAASQTVSQMEQPYAFAQGKLDEFKTGLAGFAFVQKLKGNGSLNKILKKLKEGNSFNDSFVAVFRKSPEQFFNPPRNNRRSRRR